MTDTRQAICYNPMGWTSSYWMVEDGTTYALPAGVSFVPGGGGDPVHPFAGVLNEQVVKLAAGAAWTTVFPLTIQAFTSPTATKRWGRVSSHLRYLTAYPAAERKLLVMDFSQLRLASDGTVNLYLSDVNGNPYLVGSSAAPLPLNAWFQLELWMIVRDSAGNALSNYEWLARWATLAAPPVYSSLARASANTISTGFSGAGYYGGLDYVVNLYNGWEDADAPFGVRRADFMRPSTVKGVGHLNQWPGNPANVNEVLPDDATTKDTVTPAANTPASQLYQFTNPAYVAATDLLSDTVQVGNDLESPAPGKGATYSLWPMVSDGVTDALLGVSAPTTGSYVHTLRPAIPPGSAAGTPWTLAGLQGIQAGAQAESSDGTTTFAMSTVAISIAYQKAGENGTALPPPPPPFGPRARANRRRPRFSARWQQAGRPGFPYQRPAYLP